MVDVIVVAIVSSHTMVVVEVLRKQCEINSLAEMFQGWKDGVYDLISAWESLGKRLHCM